MIDPPERRGAEGRFGGLWQFGGFRGVGTRDWAARVSLRGERGCAGEPVAREGVMLCRSEVSTFLTLYSMHKDQKGPLKIILKIWPKMFKKSKRPTGTT